MGDDYADDPFLEDDMKRTHFTSLRSGAWILSLTLSAMTAGSLALPVSAADEQGGPTFTDVREAGEDYAAQGEFQGMIPSDDTPLWGAQLIALGKGEFRLVGYPGGLPGSGYIAGTPTKSADGKRVGNKIVVKQEDYEAIVDGDSLTIASDGKTVGTLKRVHRESPTQGKKAPEGAVVLFDGSSADHFENGKMTDDHLLMADTFSHEKLGDHTMHIEFRTPFRPLARGQARGNSGVYLQSRYELQVLDSFGLSGEDNECGGIYKISKPKVNMCYPPLTWQTYDIDFVAATYEGDKKTAPARTTIRHNGVIIHDNLELKEGTPGRLPEGPGPQPLYLQGHGNPVVYRNIWYVPAK